MLKEFYGDFWEFPANVHIITTNGFRKKNGNAVMGAGIAKQAAKRYSMLPHLLGEHLRVNGNVPNAFTTPDGIILTFPVKHAWYEKADLRLIEHSARLIRDMIIRNSLYNETFVTVRPGCGNGQLYWQDVRPYLDEIWDDLANMYVVELP